MRDTRENIETICLYKQHIKNIANEKIKSYGSYKVSATEMKQIKESVTVVCEELIKAHEEIIELKEEINKLEKSKNKLPRYYDMKMRGKQ